MDILLCYSDQEPILTLEDQDNCKRLRVVLRGVSASAASQLFATYRLGQIVDGRLAWVKITALRRLARESADLAWFSRVERVVDYAEQQGRLSTQREDIFCRCEWEQSGISEAEMVRRGMWRSAASMAGIAGV
jgi:hypothetical protein